MAATALVGVFTGLLANGGAFLLVPMYLLIYGLRMREAAGTSLLVVAVLAIPTLAARWALGHINWVLAGEFAAGLLPGSASPSTCGERPSGRRSGVPRRLRAGLHILPGHCRTRLRSAGGRNAR